MRQRHIIFCALLLSIPLVLGIIFPTRSQLLQRTNMSSLRILDRDGGILREVLSCEDATSQYRRLDQISPWLIKSTLVSEDKRFFYHPGVDLFALVRSCAQNISHGKIVSGGSTITQQLARNLLHSPSRTLWNKITEALLALNLEFKLSKEEILELYFNYAPYGNQTYGAEAAAHLYFRKPCADLSAAEAAFLASIPKAPSAYNPYRYPDRVRHSAVDILKILYEKEMIDFTAFTNALEHPLCVVPKESNFRAPHLCQFVLDMIEDKKLTRPRTIHTTINPHMQEEVECILQSNISRIADANVTNAAALVLDMTTMEIVVYVGSVDFFDPLISGEVDGVQALRQPGSALKPFTYALALENGATAATLIPDMPTHAPTFGGDYMPHNYDEKYHGMVRLRTALACSYNIPAVRICEEFGTEMLLDKLQQLGFHSLDRSPVHYGLGLTLGNGEVTLLELTTAFGVFANRGYYRAPRMLHAIDTLMAPLQGRPAQIFDARIAYLVADILSDNSARSPAFGEYSPLNFPFFCAAKTGTSKDFRDNWCIGFTHDYLVGVWVGNFDGSPMHGVSGITGAGPIFRDIMLMLHHDKAPGELKKPEGFVTRRICTITGKCAAGHCQNTMDELFVAGTEPRTVCSLQDHEMCIDAAVYVADMDCNNDFSISFPDNGDIFKIDPVLRQEHQKLHLKIRSNKQLINVKWFVDDILVASEHYPFTACWQLTPGQHQITATGITDQNHELESPPITILVLK
jgi:penicillin-binding protein 1C